MAEHKDIIKNALTENFDNVPADEVQQNATTVFLADEQTKAAEKPDMIPLLSSIADHGMTNMEHSIISFLNKPIKLLDGSLGTTDTVSTFAQKQIPDDVISNALYANKLTGHLGIRADYVFTLQVNATRFTQGRYMLNFYPSAGVAITAKNTACALMHQFSLTQRTQVPHVEIDLGSETEVTLRVPYISAYPFNPIRSATSGLYERQLGVLQLHPYVATSTACNYTIWVHMENIKLFTASQPQAKKLSVTEREQKAANIGPISGALGKVSQAAGIFKEVPLLSEFAAPVGWAADIASRVASVFGWSKPSIDEPIRVTARNRAFQIQNVDGADASSKLSLSVKNQLEILPGFGGTDIDEMSWDHIKSIPAYFTSVTWSTSTAQEALLTSNSLCPNTLFLNATDNGNTTYNFLPCTFPMTMFSKFRGGFRVRLKIVKTEFHSGRLAICFDPQINNGISPPALTYAGTAYLNRHIIDVRYDNEWTFEFPFTGEFIYRDNDQSYGTFSVWVVDQLVAPSSVSASVTCIFEVAGAPDLEYAVPFPSNYTPYYPSAPQSGVITIGDARSPTPTTDFAKTCIGEKFMSLRQLVKRMVSRTRTAALPSATYYNIAPYMWGAVDGSVVTAVNPQLTADFYSLCSSIFAVARGGMRTKLMDPTGAASGSCISYNYSPAHGIVAKEYNTGTTDLLGRAGPNGFSNTNFAVLPVHDGITAEIQTPMYSSSYCFPTYDTLQVGTSGALYYWMGASAAPEVIVSTTMMVTPSNNAPIYLRGGADDLSFAYFVSIPPLVTLNGVNSFA